MKKHFNHSNNLQIKFEPNTVYENELEVVFSKDSKINKKNQFDFLL